MINQNYFLEQAINIEKNIEDLQPLAGKEVFVFPFKILSGITNLTENGEKNQFYIPSDFTTFMSVVDGKSTVIAVWENSIFADVKNERECLATYRPGYKIKGYVNEDTSFLDISSVVGLDDYIALKPKKRITLSFGLDAIDGVFKDRNGQEFNYSGNWNLDQEALLKFYIIPEVFADQWLRIISANKKYDTNGNLVRLDVTFETIVDEIASTAGVKNSLIQPSASGEGFAWPEIYEEEKDGKKEKKVRLSISKLTPKPINSLQIMCEGISGFNYAIAAGRPIRKSELSPTLDKNGEYRKKIEAPSLLLPLRTLPIYNPNLSFQSTPVDNFYVCARAKSQFEEIYQDWRESIKVLYDPTATANYEGCIEIYNDEKIKNEIFATNPKKSAGDKFLFSIKDNPEIHLSTYENIVYPTNASPGVENSIVFDKTRTYSYAEIMAHNYFIYNPMTKLPQGKQSTTTWALSSIPIVGSFLNKITLGSSIGFQINTTKIPTPDLILFLPCEIVEMNLDSTGGSKFQGNLPYDYFRTGKADQLTSLIGIGSWNTAVRVKLTHVYKNKRTNEILKTINLGQSKNPDGTNKNKIELWNSDCVPYTSIDEDDPVVGYIVDAHVNKMVFSGDYSLTLFNDNGEYPEQINYFKLKTKASNTNSIREWTNAYSLTLWKEGMTTAGSVKWPEDLVLPIKSQDINNDVLVNDEALLNKDNQLLYTIPTGQYGDPDYWIPIESLPIFDKSGFFLGHKTKVDGNWDRWITLESKRVVFTDVGDGKLFDGTQWSSWNFDDENKWNKIDFLNALNSSIPPDFRVNTYTELEQQFKEIKITFKIKNSKINDWNSGDVGYDSWTTTIKVNDLMRLISGEKINIIDQSNAINFSVAAKQHSTLFVILVVPEGQYYGSASQAKVTKFEWDAKENLFKWSGKTSFRHPNRGASVEVQGGWRGGDWTSEFIISSIQFLK